MSKLRARGAMAGLIAVALLAGCSSDGDGGTDDAESAESTESTTSTTTSTTTTAPPAPLDDQTPPAGANGITLAGGNTAWIAVLDGDELVRVDLDTGALLDRRAVAPSSGPDDLVLSDDDVLYWTGYTSGTVGSLDVEADEQSEVGKVRLGANPIAWDVDGSLLVGLAILDTGLFRIDPTGSAEMEEVLADDGAMNAFEVGEDGFLYGPTVEGEVLKVDLDKGEIVGPVASGLGFVVSVRFAPDGSMWTLTSVGEPRLSQVDPETGVVGTTIPLDQLFADNFAIGDDGTMYVTGFSEPTITVVDPDDQSLSTVMIGTA